MEIKASKADQVHKDQMEILDFVVCLDFLASLVQMEIPVKRVKKAFKVYQLKGL